MKTQILRLDTHDNVTSICDKLAWAKAPRILLAFPRRRPPVLDRLGLTLIQRSAARAGGQLAISTLSADIIENAKMVGLPVFPSIPAAHRLSWRSGLRRRTVKPGRRGDPPDLARLRSQLMPKAPVSIPFVFRISLFILGLAAFFALIALFLPSATVEIPLQRETQTLNLTVYPGVGIPGVLPGGQLPAVVIQTTVEGHLEAAATGEITVPDKPAEARLTLTNQTDQTVVIPAGTVFLTMTDPKQRYLTLTQVVVPAGMGQESEIRVQAEVPGSAGNAPAGAIQAVAGLVGLQISVTNPAPAEGGSDRAGKAASETDYSQLYDTLITSLIETALTNLQAQYGHDLLIVPESMTVEKVLEDTRQPAVNFPSDRVSLALKVAFNVMAVSREDLAAAATAGLDANLTEGWQADPASLTVEEKTAWVIIPGQRLTLDLLAARSTSPTVDAAQLFGDLRGKPTAEARQIVQSKWELNQLPNISIAPAWWPRLPFLPYRIKVVVR
ncbi:MAG: baseplate J/gp47 family protein [Bellilinea sp.]